jgi:hypothetical protein
MGGAYFTNSASNSDSKRAPLDGIGMTPMRYITPGRLPLNSAQRLPWAPEQRRVIEASPKSRLLIDAGPGTGKTVTACARIAWLLNHGGLEASQIWLVVSTRSVVQELLSRIAFYLEKPKDVSALRIASVDSDAWVIHSGFNIQAPKDGAFDHNIQKVVKLVQGREGGFSYFSTIRHLVVDEAQNVVGSRCELLLEIINALSEKAGVSVFSDEAQSIYRFAKEKTHAAMAGTLAETIRKFMSDKFVEYNLDHVHRTTDATLLKVFRDGKTLIQTEMASGAERLDSILELVKQTNHGLLGKYQENIKKFPTDQADTLLLFHRRGEALNASRHFGVQPHRLRISGLPVCIDGCVAVLLWDWTKPVLDADDFQRLWDERVGVSKEELAKNVWTVLVKAFGCSASSISVTKLVTKLASGSPTYELTLPEFGYAGPIISTIGNSKGREADEVRLYLSTPSLTNAADDKLDEEARIVFVGATRARRLLKVGSAKSMLTTLHWGSSGRAFTPDISRNKAMVARAKVEVGRVCDIDVQGLVGKTLYGRASEARDAQMRVIALSSGMVHTQANWTNAETDWRFKVELKESQGHLCYLSKTLGNDLFEIARFVDQYVHLQKGRPPKQLKHLRSFGVRTMALAPDDPVREQLHAPWCDSGLIAAPMLMGYSIANFR